MFNRMLARTACSALAVVLGAAAIPKAAPARHYSAAAADTAVKYEFEDGKAEGCFVYPNGVSDVPDDKLGGARNVRRWRYYCTRQRWTQDRRHDAGVPQKPKMYDETNVGAAFCRPLANPEL